MKRLGTGTGYRYRFIRLANATGWGYRTVHEIEEFLIFIFLELGH
jgi:hypothetical protein